MHHSHFVDEVFLCEHVLLQSEHANYDEVFEYAYNVLCAIAMNHDDMTFVDSEVCRRPQGYSPCEYINIMI